MTKIEEARALIDHFGRHLPDAVSVASLGVADKSPFVVMCIREALIWRTEELARNACDALERDNLAAGILLTRGVTESAAMIWNLRQMVEHRADFSGDALHDRLMKMWVGWKGDDEFPQAINILTFIQQLEKDIPGILHSYTLLSEYAHPNWSGVAGLFCKTDYDAHIAYFGRGQHGTDRGEMAAGLLLASLEIFRLAYDELAVLMPPYLAELEPF